MKRILFSLISVLVCAVAMSQTNWQKISTPYQYRHLRADSVLSVPYGEVARLRQVGDTARPGALFCVVTGTDTLLKFWTGARWLDIGGARLEILPNELIFGGTVTPLGGYRFSVQSAIYRIDNVLYESDSGTVTIDSSDATLNRIDRIYLATDNAFHVLVGELAGAALEPQVDGDQIGLAFINIPAASDPFITTTKVFDENTESAVTNTGTTTDGNNATNVFTGTKSLNVTNISNNDVIFFTKAPALSSWNVLGFDGLSMFFRLKAVMNAAANLRVQLYVGATAVSAEVIIPLNKANILSYQAVTISAASFGNITNTAITRVRIRYTRAGNSTNYLGFYLDNIFFVDGVSQPPSGSIAQFTFNPPVGFQVSPATTQQSPGSWTMSQIGGTGGQVYTPAGWATLPTIPNTIGVVNGRTKVANALQYDGVELFGQDADASNRGWMTSAMFLKLDSTYYITNLGDGDSLAMPVNPFTVGIKSWVVIGGTPINTDSTFGVDLTGLGGGSSLVPVTGTGTATGDITGALGSHSLAIGGDASSSFQFHNTTDVNNSVEFKINDSQNGWILSSVDLDSAQVAVHGSGGVYLHSTLGKYNIDHMIEPVGSTNKMVIWDSVTNQLRVTAIPSGGGGGSPFLPVTGTETATGNIIGDLDGNNIYIISGGTQKFYIDIANNQSYLAATNPIGSGNASYLIQDAPDNEATFELGSYFNGPGNNAAKITSLSNVSTSTLTHTAGTNNFAGNILPVTDDAVALGSTTKRFSDLFLAEGGVINWDNGDATLTQVGDVVTLAGADLKVTTPGNVSTSVVTTDGTQTLTNKSIAIGSITGLGTGVATALAVNVGSAGAPVLFNGAGGTPSSLTLTNATGLPHTSITGLGAGIATFWATPSSANFFAAVTDESGSGAILGGTSPTITTPTISGAIITSAVVQTGTNASGTGAIPYDFDIRVRSDETLANSTSDQPLLTNTAHDLITIQANTTYDFIVEFDLTHGAVSHNLEFGMIPTTATITNIAYDAIGWVTAVGTNTATQNSVRTKVTTTTQVIAAGLVATETVQVTGWFTVGNTGGSIMPTIQFSADPTGTILLKAGARFILTARGNDTYTERGPIN